MDVLLLFAPVSPFGKLSHSYFHVSNSEFSLKYMILMSNSIASEQNASSIIKSLLGSSKDSKASDESKLFYNLSLGLTSSCISEQTIFRFSLM